MARAREGLTARAILLGYGAAERVTSNAAER